MYCVAQRETEIADPQRKEMFLAEIQIALELFFPRLYLHMA